MSVAPDFLLQSAPEVRPKAPAAKAPASAPEPSSHEASSFAEVYAKERQAKAAERKEASAKAAEERSANAKPADEPGAEAAAEQPAVAESGKTLPDEVAEGGEEGVDPLLLMAMTGQLPAADAVDSALSGEAAVVDGETDALLQASAPTVASAAPAVLTEASHDPELDMLNSLSGVKLALEIGAKNQAAAQQQLSPGAVAAEKSANAGQGFANALAAFAGEAMPSEEAPAEGLESELLGEGLELSATREAQSDGRAEAFTSKLSALSQAINQQTNVAQRLPLVPGQPVQVGHPGMSEAVVDKVMWLSSQNLKSAEIQLDPAELGRLEVRIELNKDQAAQVTFVSANPNVRDQLEGQAHRLRELFAQQGMNQLDVNVSDQSMARGSQGGGEEGQRRSASRGMGGSGDDDVLSGVSEIRAPSAGTAPRGLVDYYA